MQDLQNDTIMGRELQKKKNRSSIPKTRNKKKGLLANGKKKINIYGNKIIADNWYVISHHLPLPPLFSNVDKKKDKDS